MAIRGTPGNDTLVNITGLPETLYGFAGNDRLIAGAYGGDELHGDIGDDTLLSGNDGAFDRLYGGAGNDVIFGGPSDDLLVGDDGHDTLYGGRGNDTLRGLEGFDVLDGYADHRDTDLIEGDRLMVGSIGLRNALIASATGEATYTMLGAGNVTVVLAGVDAGTVSNDSFLIG